MKDTRNITDLTHTDLACERRRADVTEPGIEFTKEIGSDHIWERIRVTNEQGASSIGRPIGRYDTLTLARMDLLSEREINEAAERLARELRDIVGDTASKILVVGLGNRELTADSVGPKAACTVNATMHLEAIDPEGFPELKCSRIAVLIPGVTADTGIDAADVIGGACERIKPNAVIAIDSLASRSEKRLGRTVQISDTGIIPGSGIGSTRTPLNEKTLLAPVYAIGVPTVINAAVIRKDTSSKKVKNTESMFVSPKEIDGISSSAAKIIGLGINKAFGIV